ncbi:MAG: DUF2182 domain-containing protein [Candidatus Limnocylindrales bacterium]
MTADRVLVALRLARPARRRGFCPACAFLLPGDPGDRRGTEASAEGITVAVVLAVATVAWAVTGWQMLAAGMPMGLGSLPRFATTWMVMMTAVMLPSAVPLFSRFARRAEGRRRRPYAVATLGSIYLLLWLVFGLVGYLTYAALGMPWPEQTLVNGVALASAAVYALTPLKRRSQDRCREVCALHGPLPFGLVRAGAVVGWRYGLSCLACSGGLMVAMVLTGMTSLGLTIVLAGLVLLDKAWPRAAWHSEVASATFLFVIAVGYVALA